MQWYTIVILTILGVHLANFVVFALSKLDIIRKETAYSFGSFMVFLPLSVVVWLVLLYFRHHKQQ